MIESIRGLDTEIRKALKWTEADAMRYVTYEEHDGFIIVKERQGKECQGIPPAMRRLEFIALMKNSLEAKRLDDVKGMMRWQIEKGRMAEGSEEKEPQIGSVVGVQEPQPVNVKLSQLQYDVFSPRKRSKKWICHLKEAIESEGPESFPLPKVRVHPNGSMAERVYQLVDGEHFCKALEELGIETVKVQLCNFSDEEADFQAMRLNQVHGKPLVKRSQGWLSQRFGLLDVEDDVITRVKTSTHAREIASAPEEIREEIAEKVEREALSTRETHAVVGAIKEVPEKKKEFLTTSGRPKVFSCGLPDCMEGTYDPERYDGIHLCARHRDLFNRDSGAVEKLKAKKPFSPQKVEKKSYEKELLKPTPEERRAMMHPKVSKMEEWLREKLSEKGIVFLTDQEFCVVKTYPDFYFPEANVALYLDGEKVHRDRVHKDDYLRKRFQENTDIKAVGLTFLDNTKKSKAEILEKVMEALQ